MKVQHIQTYNDRQMETGRYRQAGTDRQATGRPADMQVQAGRDRQAGTGRQEQAGKDRQA